MMDRLTPWPDAEASRYRALGYWMGQRLDVIAAGHLPARSQAPALIDDEGWLSYGQLEAAVRLSGSALRRAGVSARDRVVIHLGNCNGFVVAALALMRIGAVPVYSLPSHGGRELTGITAGAGASAILVSGHDAAAVARARAVPSSPDAGPPRSSVPPAHSAGPGPRVLLLEEIVPSHQDLVRFAGPGISARELPDDPHVPADTGDVAFLQLSGGTTGAPKLIPRTHDDYHYSIRRSVQVCRIGASDTMLILLPAAHNFPMSSPGFFGMLHAGGATVLAGPRPPREIFELIARASVTVLPLVPPLALTLVNAAERAGDAVAPLLEPLRTVQVGGAKLAPELAARIRPALGANPQQVFGMAEGLVCYTDPEDASDRVLHVQGRPMSEEDEVRIVAPDGGEAPCGVPGDLQTRGPYTIRGYWGDPTAHAASFTADGFYITGDVVVRDEEGYLTVRGRSKDHINRGGEKISAEEVENLLMKHGAVDDAIVVGVPDEYLGEKAVGVVVPCRPDVDGDDASSSAGPTAQELVRHLRELQVDDFKIPDRFTVRKSLPTTGVGKISRADLRKAVQQALEEETT